MSTAYLHDTEDSLYRVNLWSIILHTENPPISAAALIRKRLSFLRRLFQNLIKRKIFSTITSKICLSVITRDPLKIFFVFVRTVASSLY